MSFNEEESIDILLFATDVDSENLIFSISGGEEIVASLNVDVVSFSSCENCNGLEEFEISVSDDGDPQLTDSQNVEVTVLPVNDPPFFILDTFGDNDNLFEDSTYVYNFVNVIDRNL